MPDNKQKETVYIIKPYLDELNNDELEEIVALVNSANADVLKTKTPKIREINPATYVGTGKLDEIKTEIEDLDVDTVVFDGELSPVQTLNVSDALGGVKVIDRTTLILDIFAQNAKSAEGKLQVELAQLKYVYPRLKGKGSALSQQGGGIGTRGPGETKLETDRRHIRRRINSLEAELKELEKRRELQKNRRNKNSVKTVALVGYTNTGKSTLLNRLTGSDTYVKDKLFATLDPTIRKLILENIEVVLIDTVGFVRNIPHNLIEAFKSTLESAVEADLILNVCSANGDFETELKTTEQTLKELDAKGNIITVINKCDTVESLSSLPKGVYVSAKTGYGIDNLLNEINKFFSDTFKILELFIPYSEFKELSAIKSIIKELSSEYTDDGLYIKASVPSIYYKKIKKYRVKK